MRRKQPNVFPKKRKRKVTARDAAKLHERLIEQIDRLKKVYELPPDMIDFWRVVFGTDESVAGQIKILNAQSGGGWTRWKYFKLRGILERKLGKSVIFSISSPIR